MSFFQNNYLTKADKPNVKTKNKPKILIPVKPSYLIPSPALKNFQEKEAHILKRESFNNFNNHSLNINFKIPIRNRNIFSKDMTLTNNNLNNSIKNVHILLKNNNNYDYKSIIHTNSNFLITNNSTKNIYNYYENIDENKENMKNKYNTNYNYLMKIDKTIIVNKANKFIKEKRINKPKNNVYKKINLKQATKRRTLSSNINQIVTNINSENIRKSYIGENPNNNNNSLLEDLVPNHRKNSSIIINNIKEKNISLKKSICEKIKSSRSFSNSVEKNNIINNQKTKNNSINKSNFNNTTSQFYSRLKQIIPYSNNNKSKINDYNSINKCSEQRNNFLNKSFTTNNFNKRFNLSQYEKYQIRKVNEYKIQLNTIEPLENTQKIKDYFAYIKANNNSNLITNNYNKLRKKYRTKSISDLSNLNIKVLNKSRDSVISQKNFSVIENEKEPKKKIFKKILKIDSCTIPGYSLNGVKQKNQDSFFLKKNFLSKDEQFFIGICDGHGLFGDLVSQYISETLPLNVKSTSKEELIQAFIDTNNSLINKTKIDCSLSGTTCTSLIITLDKIICANIGNTRAILAKYENGYYNTINLSRDHKPTESEEIKRILSEGGVIKQLYNKNKKEFFGPERIWLKNSDIPGLSMSRSFGDNLAHTVGVINIPEVKTFDYTGGEKFIVIASDSIWQYIDSDECVRIIKDYYEKNMDAVGALNSLVTEAIKRWKKQENKIEDITAVVIFFE